MSYYQQKQLNKVKSENLIKGKEENSNFISIISVEFGIRKDQIFLNKDQQSQDDGLNALKKFLMNRIDAFPDQNNNKFQSNNPSQNYSNCYKRILNKHTSFKSSIPARTRLKSARAYCNPPTSANSDCQSSLKITSKNISKLVEEQKQQKEVQNIPIITYMANLTSITSVPRFRSPSSPIQNSIQPSVSERLRFIEINSSKGIVSSHYKTHKNSTLEIEKPKSPKKVRFILVMYYQISEPKQTEDNNNKGTEHIGKRQSSIKSKLN